MSDINERVRERIRSEMARRDLSQQSLAELLQWTQSRVAQKLTGRTPITLEELEGFGIVLGLSVVELVRDHGLEFCAEMTPLELRFHQRLKQLPVSVRDALLLLIDSKNVTATEDRGATKRKPAIPDLRRMTRN